MSWHRGPRIDKISPTGAGGLIFGIGALLIFLVGVPQMRWFMLLSLITGAVVGLLLYLRNR